MPRDSAASGRMWAAAVPIWRRIESHPFLLGLQDGSLAHDRFRTFLEQDRIFLDLYARALCGLAARAPNPELVLLLCGDAAAAVSGELTMETDLLRALGPAVEQVDEVAAFPTTLAYGNYLLASALSGSFSAGLAAVLPCYWVYGELGRQLSEHGSPSPIYQRWIDSYADEEFESVVARIRSALDEISIGLSEVELGALTRKFLTAFRYEWMFWEMAWGREGWPV